MIGEALAREIEQYSERMRRTNPLFSRAEDGTLTASAVARYLASLREILRETPRSLTRARDRAAACGDHRLAAYWGKKVGEEVGHDEWASSDLAHVAIRSASSTNPELVGSVADFVAFQRATIDEDPMLFLAYALFAEYLTVLIGPRFLDDLEERCGIPRSAMTVIAKHVEADKHHVEDTLEEIDELVGDPRKLPRLREILRGSIELFERFCVEVTRTEDRHAGDGTRDRHVSAA